MMSIHEQIIGFLDGELTDQSTLAELMHVLAVSPEKREFLVEQVRLARAMGTVAGSIAPSAAADAAILSAIAAIDTPMPPPSRAPAPPSPALRNRRGLWLMIGIAAVAIALSGFAIGYLLQGDRSTTVAKLNSGSSIDRAALPRFSIPQAMGIDLQRTIAEMLHDNSAGSKAIAPLLRRIEQLRASKERVRQVIVRHPASVESEHQAGFSAYGGDSNRRPLTIDQAVGPRRLWRAAPLTPPSLSRPAPAGSDPASRSISSTDGAIVLIDDGTGRLRQWSVGLRAMMRLSLPRVYGLPTGQTLLTDREITFGVQLDEEASGLKRPLQLGGAVGNTQFGQSFRRQNGGSSVSTVIEQTPNLWYGRGWISPEIISINGFSGDLELGAGGTMIGPFATIGLATEYRPIENISVGLGVSAWLLWSQFEAQNVLSANLNGHFGARFWF